VTALEIFEHCARAQYPCCAYTNKYEKYMHINVHVKMYSVNVCHVVTALEILVHNALACAYTNTHGKYMHIHVHIEMCTVDVFHVVTALEIFVHNALACAYTNTYEKYMNKNVHF